MKREKLYKTDRVVKNGKEKSITYKRAELAELQEIIKIYRNVMLNIENKSWFKTSQGNIANAVLGKGGVGLIGLDRDEIAVFGSLAIDEASVKNTAIVEKAMDIDIPLRIKDEICWVDNTFVKISHRGLGLQKTIIELLCEKAERLGYKLAFVMVHPKNTYSIKNIEACGFILLNDVPFKFKNTMRNVYIRVL